MRRWIVRSFSKKEEVAWKYDSTQWWEHVVQTKVPDDLIFLPLAKMYNQLAPIIPAERVVEGFFSIAGFLFDARRYNLSTDSLKTVCLQYLWKKVEKNEMFIVYK